jgi:hypothetical protein
MTPSCHFPSLFLSPLPISLYTDFSPISSPSLGGPLVFFLALLLAKPGTALVSVPAACADPNKARLGTARGALGGVVVSRSLFLPTRENESGGCRPRTKASLPTPTTLYHCRLRRHAGRPPPASTSPARPGPRRQRIGGLSATRHRAEREGNKKRARERKGKGEKGNRRPTWPCPALSPVLSRPAAAQT